jgi:hypothetical protein
MNNNCIPIIWTGVLRTFLLYFPHVKNFLKAFNYLFPIIDTFWVRILLLSILRVVIFFFFLRVVILLPLSFSF